MRRVIIFLILCLASMNICLAGDYGAVVCPFSCLKKSDNNIILYSKNLEEIFANDLINELSGAKKFNAPSLSSLKKTLATNPQINSGLDTDEKVKLLAKVYGANRVIKVVSRYEIKSLNANLNSKALEKMTLIKDDTTLRLRTDVYLIDPADNKVLWSNTYFKSVNFEAVNKKDMSILTNYYEKLAQSVTDELKVKQPRQNEVNTDYNKQNKEEVTEPQKLETIELHHTHLTPETPKNTSIKPVLQLQENVSDKAQVNKKNVEKQTKVVVPKSDDSTKTQTSSSQKKFKFNWGKQNPNGQNNEVNKSKSIEKKSKNTVEKVKDTDKNEPVKNKKQTDNIFSRIRNTIQVTPASSGVQEVKPDEIKTVTPQTQPTYTNIHVTPRKNSRNYTPQFNNSINDI